MTGPRLYFGYGSNLNAADWTRWCGSKSCVGADLNPRCVARLPDHDIAFTYNSQSRQGGVLDVIDRPGQLVNGVIFEPNAAGWDALTKKEGAVYEPFDTFVIDEHGSEVAVTVFRVVKRRRQSYVGPHADYVEIVRAGLRKFDLSDAALNAVAKGIMPDFSVDGLFVYGTLMRGEYRFNVLQHGGLECVLLAETHGRLLDLGQFPGLVDVSAVANMVQGEFVRVTNVEPVVREVDRIEGFRGFGQPGSLFRRNLIEVGVGDGRVRRAWTYCYGGNEPSAAVIESGDWRLHRGKREKFLHELTAAHIGDNERAIAESIASGLPYSMADDRKGTIQSLLPLAKSLCRGEISERLLAQASGRWAVVP